MSCINGNRGGCKDVYHAYLVKDASYATEFEIPVLRPEILVPNKLIAFSKALRSQNYDQWVHFYEDDVAIERIWNQLRRYLNKLSKFNGVITPDFSLYYDMPVVMQEWNTYRGKALGYWWQNNGLHVIPNVRFSDKQSYRYCCAGIAPYQTICVGSHGCLKVKDSRKEFIHGMDYVIETLKPQNVIVYGSAPASIFDKYVEKGIHIISFQSEYASCHRKDVIA